MKVDIETITPDRAARYLTHNTGNRSIKKGHVRSLARDIANGKWRLTGEAIKFNCDGELLDGQHRLQAIVAAKTPAPMLVIRGLERGVRTVLDTGAKRTAGDALSQIGVSNCNHVGAACRYAMILRDDRAVINRTYTNSEIVDFYNNHPGISEEITRIAKKAPPGFGTMVAAVNYAVGHDDRALDGWLYGEGGRDHPCVVARERAIRQRLSGKPLHAMSKLKLVAWSFVSAMRGDRKQALKVTKAVHIPGWN